MSKKLLIVMLVAVLTASYAQAQLTYGVRTGVNLTNVFQWEDDDMKGHKWKGGFQLGVVAGYPLLEDVLLHSGILFSQQGMKVGNSIKCNLNYIQIPINLQYTNQHGTIFQVGPYLGFGIGGKMKATSGSSSYSEKIKFGSGNDAFNTFDFGLGAGLGFQLSNIQAVLGLNYGLTNIAPDVKMKNLGLVFTVTYLLGK